MRKLILLIALIIGLYSVNKVNAQPATPGIISGNKTVCSGSTNTYSITTVAGATSYTWTLPSGWSGASTNTSITSTASDSSGKITVTANNSNGSSLPQTLAVSVNTPPSKPEAISGNGFLCSESLNQYSIASIPGATSYTWTLPSGWMGSSTDTSVIATNNTKGGNVTVAANNACGSSALQTLAVTFNSAIPLMASGSTTFCKGGSVVLSAPTGQGYSYQWKINGHNISGATNAAYTTDSAGLYTVILTNGKGCAITLGGSLPMGGTITDTGGYRIHTFASNDTFAIPAGFNANAEILVVGGGGGGSKGGGGGAGGFIDTTVILTGGSMSVTVGNGGTGSNWDSAGNGGNSVLGLLTAIGGGAGGGYNGDATAGKSGGSGGGGGMNQFVGANPYSLGGHGTVGQGNAGGNTAGQNCSPCGGGGGAGGAGALGTSGNGGMLGGPGLPSSVSGKKVYYAGGGGGGSSCAGFGAGGIGGGGAGSQGNGTAGLPNTGGGGGGGAGNQGGSGGAGGSGIIIVAYPDTITSGGVAVTVNPLPVTPVITANGAILSSSAATDNQWYKNDSIITGATSQNYTVTENAIYTVKVTDGNGCSATSTLFHYTTAGIQNLTENNSITIYPNPSTGIFTIQANSQVSIVNCQLSIYNLLGQRVYFSPLIINNSIDLSDHPKGMYFISLQNEEGLINKKVVIE